MKKHISVYLKHFKYGEQDVILCEACSRPAVDVHHVKYKSRGGTDEIENLIGLCRKCHDLAHNETLKESDLLLIHRYFLTGSRKQFIK